MKKLLLIAFSSLALIGISQPTAVSRATLKTAPYSLINRQVPASPTTGTNYLNNFLQSYWNTADDGTPLTAVTGWGVLGNALGNNTSFLGSTDNRSLIFKTNSNQAFKIDSLRKFRFNTPNAGIIFQDYPSDIYPTIYMGEGALTATAPTASNYTFLEYAGITYVNNGGSGKALNMLVNHNTKFQIVGTFTTGNHYAFEYFPNNHTNITAGAVNFAYLLRGASKTWTTGAIAIQKEFELQAPTWGATSASTMTIGYNMFVRQPTTGANMTITNKYSLGLEGNMICAGAALFGASTGSPSYTVDVTGNGRFTSTLTVGGLAGTTTNDNTSAGNVGEYVSAIVAVGSAVSFTTATAMNIMTISVTAGDWDIEGNVNFNETSSTVSARSAGITSTSATIPTDGSQGYCGVQSTVTSEINSITLPRKRISVSSTTTIYLVGSATFAAGTCTGFGTITARRVR